MVKLALCFSGDPRTYNKCFDSIKQNLLDVYDCDIFISSYLNNDEIIENILQLYKPKDYKFHNKNDITNIVTEYIKNLKMVKVNTIKVDAIKNVESLHLSDKIEDFFFNFDNYKNNFTYKNLFENAICQFFGINDVAEMCKKYMLEHNQNYDYILRIRLDNIFYNKFILNELNEKEILVNVVQNYSDSIKLHDHFFMCKPKTYFEISSLYSNLPLIIETINNNNCWLPTAGYQETLLFIQTFLYKVKVKTANFFFGKLP